MADRMERIVNGKKETVISVELMRRSDAYTIANFVPGAELMYRAAMGVFHAVDWHGRIAILTGGGNNGGDGFALACILADHGISPDVFRISERLTEDGLHYFAQATQKGVCIRPFQESTALTHYDILVDCILGTGFSGMVRGLARNAIQSVNVADGFVVSVDINSGLNGDTGEAELAVKSDLTVSIGYYKQGLFAGDAAQYRKAVVNVDIGILLI